MVVVVFGAPDLLRLCLRCTMVGSLIDVGDVLAFTL